MAPDEREREREREKEREREFLIGCVIVGVGKSEICRTGMQARNLRKNWCCSLEFEFCRAVGWGSCVTGFLCCNLEENAFF